MITTRSLKYWPQSIQGFVSFWKFAQNPAHSIGSHSFCSRGQPPFPRAFLHIQILQTRLLSSEVSRGLGKLSLPGCYHITKGCILHYDCLSLLQYAKEFYPWNQIGWGLHSTARADEPHCNSYSYMQSGGLSYQESSGPH